MWKRQSLRNKFIAIFLAVVGPIMAFLYYSTQYAENAIRSQAARLNQNLLTMHQREMDKYMQDLELYLYNLSDTDPDLKSIGMHEPGSVDYILAKYAVLRRFKNDSGYFEKADDFFLYMRDKDDFVSLSGGRLSAADHARWLDSLRAVAAGGPDRWQALESADSLVKAISLGDNVYLGASIAIGKLIDPLVRIEIGDRGRMMLLSGDGSLLTKEGVAEEQAQAMKRAIGDAADSPDGYAVLRNFKDGENYIGVAQSSAFSDLHVLIVMPEGEVLKALHFFERAVVAIPPLAVLVIALYAGVLQQVLIKPLRRIARGMRDISRGDLSTRLNVPVTEELADATFAFNNMADQIERLKIDVYEEQLKAQKAEYMRLQVQINPHFYLNSLNIIYNLAAVRNYDSIQSMALHLGSYFRFTMQHNRSTVALAQELEHAAHYLEIQRLRFPDALTFRISASEKAGKAQVPPLTIQPLVENGIVHGFKDIDRPFHIEVTAAHAEDLGLTIEIADNGVGFSEEALERLNRSGYLDEQEDRHIGVRNMYQRFRLRFGPAVRLKCFNREEGGAVVRLGLPAGTVETEGEDNDG